MTGPSFAVVCTTVHDGGFLKHYAKALEGANATMYVIPDRKTPAPLYAAVENYRAQGLAIQCPDLNEQTAFLAKLGAPDGFFPWDTDHRRNVGYLMAYESGADIVISIDDDNLPAEWWLTEHALPLMGARKEQGIVSSGAGFFNPCSLLHTWPWPPVAYARGFPYGKRGQCGEMGSFAECDVAINAGLWLGEPDIDAITRLAAQPRSETLSGSAVLGNATWAPVNSQNTAVRREVIPAYYFFRSGRFGDIYQGYLAQACAKHLGHSVRFGTPVVRHERNDHDLLKDIEAELPDILILDGWLDWLTSLKLEGGTYAEAYAFLAGQLRDHAELGAVGRDAKQVMHSMAGQMSQWLKLCGRLA